MLVSMTLMMSSEILEPERRDDDDGEATEESWEAVVSCTTKRP